MLLSLLLLPIQHGWDVVMCCYLISQLQFLMRKSALVSNGKLLDYFHYFFLPFRCSEIMLCCFKRKRRGWKKWKAICILAFTWLNVPPYKKEFLAHRKLACQIKRCLSCLLPCCLCVGVLLLFTEGHSPTCLCLPIGWSTTGRPVFLQNCLQGV